MPYEEIHDSATSAWRQVYDTALSGKDSRIELLISEKQALEVELSRTRLERDGAVADVASLKQRISALEEEIRVLKEQIPQRTAFENTWFEDVPIPASEKKILAHVVPWDSQILDNRAMSSDYYSKAFLSVNGEVGKHAKYGGYHRDAPLHAGPYPLVGGGNADSPTLGTRRLAEKANIEHGIFSGLDGFFVDIVANSVSHPHWIKILSIFDEASENYKSFKVVPMLDLNGGIASLPVAQIATLLNTLLSKECAWRLSDGRYILGSFKAEAWDAARWNSLIAEIKKLGKDVYLVGAFNVLTQLQNLPMFRVGGQWSPGADPICTVGTPFGFSETKARGQIPLVPVMPQGQRSYSGWYDEARGLSSLASSWDRVIRTDAEFVQIVTWNDFAEGSQSMASRKQGTAVGAYNRYRILQLKTGSRPAIVTDQVIISHRNQVLNATFPSAQTPIKQLSRGTMTASKDEVEVRTFFTKAQPVQVNAGTVSYTYTAPAGEHAEYVPTTAGKVRVRFGSTDYTSPVEIRSSSGNQDREWVHAWPQDTHKVFDPTPAT